MGLFDTIVMDEEWRKRKELERQGRTNAADNAMQLYADVHRRLGFPQYTDDKGGLTDFSDPEKGPQLVEGLFGGPAKGLVSSPLMAGVIARRNSKTADLKALAKAGKLEEKLPIQHSEMSIDDYETHQKGMQDIIKETGWGRGVDGEWVYNIPDSEMVVTPNLGLSKAEYSVQHPRLYKAYPHMKNQAMLFGDQSLSSSFMPYELRKKYGDKIHYRINAPTPEERAMVTAHEFQHGVADTGPYFTGTNISSMKRAMKEGTLPIGKNQEWFRDQAKSLFSENRSSPILDEYRQKIREFENSDAFSHYKNSAGEIEADFVMNAYNPHALPRFKQQIGLEPWQPLNRKQLKDFRVEDDFNARHDLAESPLFNLRQYERYPSPDERRPIHLSFTRIPEPIRRKQSTEPNISNSQSAIPMSGDTSYFNSLQESVAPKWASPDVPVTDKTLASLKASRMAYKRRAENWSPMVENQSRGDLWKKSYEADRLYFEALKKYRLENNIPDPLAK